MEDFIYVLYAMLACCLGLVCFELYRNGKKKDSLAKTYYKEAMEVIEKEFEDRLEEIKIEDRLEEVKDVQTQTPNDYLDVDSYKPPLHIDSTNRVEWYGLEEKPKKKSKSKKKKSKGKKKR